MVVAKVVSFSFAKLPIYRWQVNGKKNFTKQSKVFSMFGIVSIRFCARNDGVTCYIYAFR